MRCIAAAFIVLSVCRVPLANGQESDFPALFDTQDTEQQPLSTTQDALKSVRLPAGFQVSLFAAEPDVQNPIAMAWDTRGRLWIAENYTYAERETNFESAVRDRIIILEDSDHDGRADRRTVFWDQANKLTSIEIGAGGVWALCAPQLLFLPDRDGDDRCDGEPLVVLDGWNDDDVRHNIVNGLRWGPDGWLYGRHGILATSTIGPPGTSPDQRVPINCGIWRYHPARGKFEAVAHGTTNPWGMDWDQYGEMFFVNTVIGHLWHVLYGCHYQRMYGEDFDPYLYELMPQVGDHVHWNTGEIWSDVRDGVSAATDQAGGGHAHSGLMIYLGDNWPADCRGDVFMVNLHGHRLNRDDLLPSGTSYVAKHKDDFLFIDDPWFRGIDLSYGPDGSVYVLDWTDIGECHENDGVHRTSGRIYRVSYGQPKQVDANLQQLNAAQLIGLQQHENEWFVRLARLELIRRAANGQGAQDTKDVRTALAQLFEKSNDQLVQLRALWCWYVLGGIGKDQQDVAWLTANLTHPSPHVRTWAVRLLAENMDQQGSQYLAADRVSRRLETLAASEESGLVLLTIASALQRLPVEQRFPLATALARRDQLAADPYYPLLLWYGIAPAAGNDPGRAVKLAAAAEIPKLRILLARRVTQQLDAQPDAFSALIELLGKADDQAAADLLEGMNVALRGRRQAPRPAGWEEVVARLKQIPDETLQQRVRELALVFGDGRALDELLAIAASDTADKSIRRDAIRALVAARAEAVAPLLEKLLANRDLAIDAVRGLAALGQEQSAAILIDGYAGFSGNVREEVLQALVSRPAFARALLTAVAGGRIDAADLSAFQLRQLRSLPDEALVAEVDRIWPQAASINEAAAERIKHYAAIINRQDLAAPDLRRGQVLFQRACVSCHMLFGEGGKVGPDLTGAQRGNLQYLLENIVDPSAQVAENFRMSVVVLTDGRVVNGIVGDVTEQTISVQTPTEKLVVLQEDIEEMRVSQLSIMPEQLLEPLTAEEVRDLFAYLQLTQPLAPQ